MLCYEVYTLRAHPKIVRVPMVDMEETVVAEKGVEMEVVESEEAVKAEEEMVQD